MNATRGRGQTTLAVLSSTRRVAPARPAPPALGGHRQGLFWAGGHLAFPTSLSIKRHITPWQAPPPAKKRKRKARSGRQGGGRRSSRDTCGYAYAQEGGELQPRPRRCIVVDISHRGFCEYLSRERDRQSGACFAIPISRLPRLCRSRRTKLAAVAAGAQPRHSPLRTISPYVSPRARGIQARDHATAHSGASAPHLLPLRQAGLSRL